MESNIIMHDWNMSSSKGLLVAIEGPNGIGKTTLIELIENSLRNAGHDVNTTKEPTTSELGCWIREKHGVISGRALACLIAGNRYEHIEEVIQPALMRNEIVLTDRYLASSFVYQINDGVIPDFIWAVNSQCLIADLTISLTASPESLSRRMTGRSTLTRFEQSMSSVQELDQYRQACEYLRTNGWLVEEHANSDGCPDKVAEKVASRILHLLAQKHPRP